MVVNHGTRVNKDGVKTPHTLPGYVLGLLPHPDKLFKDVSGLVSCEVGDKVACIRDMSSNNIIFLQDSYSARPTLQQVDKKYVIRSEKGNSLYCVAPVVAGSVCFAFSCGVKGEGSVLQASENACYMHPNDIYLRGALSTPQVNVDTVNTYLLQRHEGMNWEYRVNGEDIPLAPNVVEWEGLYLGGGPYASSCEFDLYALVVCLHVSSFYLTSLENYFKE